MSEKPDNPPAAKRPMEIHINRRGCRGPLNPNTALALAEMFRLAALKLLAQGERRETPQEKE